MRRCIVRPREGSDSYHTEVRFEVEGNAVRILWGKSSPGGRGKKLLERMRGRATSGMSTEETMALTRGEN